MGLAAAIKKVMGVTPELRKGSGGVFDVVVDGRRIYSKHETGTFPDPDEILDELSRPA